MFKIFISQDDDPFIVKIMNHGLKTAESARMHKWMALRIALAISLRIPTEPDPGLDDLPKGTEYDLRQVSWFGQEKQGGLYPVSGIRTDYTNAYKALLSVYHDENLIQNNERFRLLLQRHIRRGLREIRTTWKEQHDFYEYLYQSLFSDVPDASDIDTANSDNLVPRLMDALMEIGVSAEMREVLTGPRITRVLVFLSDVHDLDRTRRGLEKISFSLGLKDKGVFLENTQTPKVAALDVPRPAESWEKIIGSDLWNWMEKPPSSMWLPVWPGVDVLGTPFVMDLSKAPHLLVAGTTGSGKSVCLHALIIALLKFGGKHLQLCLIDPKKVEFSSYSQLPILFGQQVYNSARDSLGVLKELVAEMEDRINRLSAAGWRDIEQAEEKGETHMPRIVVFVEELADFFSMTPDAEDLLIKLAQKARATGIHLVLATQRPDAQTFRGQLRSNIPARIALSVQKSTESKIILDETGAERLTGQGDMLIKETGGKCIRVHGVLVGPDDIARAVNFVRGQQ